MISIFSRVINRKYLVAIVGLMFMAGITQTGLAKAKETKCYIEDLCERVNTEKKINNSLTTTKSIILKECGYKLIPDKCPLDQVIEHCWAGDKVEFKKCEQ